MPYLVTTTTRIIVDTLDEAREAAVVAVHAHDGLLSAHDAALAMNDADDLPESGGIVGPLPDGTTVEVRPS